MKHNFRWLLLAIGLAFLVSTPFADATFVTAPFTNADTFDNDVPGSTAGPFTDTVTSVIATITTVSLTPVNSTNNTVSTGAGKMGINAPGADTADEYDPGESWTFKWSQNSQFVGIDFGGYSTAAEDLAFAVQSPEWIGLSITTGSANVIFTSATGTFTFKDGTASDIFTATDLYDGGSPPLIADTRSITISYTAPAGQSAFIEGFSFNLLIPEPSSAVLLVLGALVLSRRKWSA